MALWRDSRGRVSDKDPSFNGFAAFGLVAVSYCQMIRVYNISFEQMDRQVAIDVGEAMGEIVAIDWRDRKGCWIDYIRIRVKIDVSRPLRRVVHLVGNEGTEIWIEVENNMTLLKGKEKVRAGTVDDLVKEDWIVGEDFNAIINDVEKSSGRRKPKVAKDEFREITEELAHVDVKTNRGWFTWTNDCEGSMLIKERIDIILISASALESIPFLSKNVVRQANSDHNAILLDTMGRKLKEEIKDSRLLFKFEACWAKDKEAKKLIMRAWGHNNVNILDGIEKIDRLIDESYLDSNVNMLKDSRVKLGWVNGTNDICGVAWNYFHKLFKSEAFGNDDRFLNHIQKSITPDINNMLERQITDDEILTTFNPMDSRKALDIDGLSGLLFKENWEVVAQTPLGTKDSFMARCWACELWINWTVILVCLSSWAEKDDYFSTHP
ncbi:hypothetical protein GOBAR_DD08076 [Gossypium barbadense]|nr:hypothetical protein GOBAR_DD08076 [Gossypium barbadense]